MANDAKQVPIKTKKQQFQGELKVLIEKYFGPLDALDPIDRDKFFKDIFHAYCDVMMRDWQINLYVNRLMPEDLHLEKNDEQKTWKMPAS